MKRRSVTFTDSPPEVIDDNCGSGKLFVSLPIGNSFPWSQLAKLAERERRNVADSRRQLEQFQQQQQHHYSRSVPDLNKQGHYLSTVTDGAAVCFRAVSGHNPGRNVLQQKQRMDPIYLSIPNLDTYDRPQRLSREGVEPVRNVRRMDTAWDSHGVWKGQKKHPLHHYNSVSDYYLGKRRSIAAVTGIDLPCRAGAGDDGGGDNGSDSGVCVKNTDNSRRISQKHKKSTYSTDNSENGSTDLERRDSGGDNDGDNGAGNNHSETNKGKGDDEGDDEMKSDRRKLAQQFLRRYYYYSNDYKKHQNATATAVAAATASSNWSWRNADSAGADFSRCCYSLLNKQLHGNHSRQHHYGSGTTTITSPTFSTSNMRNVGDQERSYHSPMYSKSQQQLVDEMAKHIAECLEQFNTGLDKVLQARQLLESSHDLPVDDRETMLRLLNQAMRTSRKRMECTDDRYDPDGRHSESPNGLPGQRQCAPAQQHGITSTGGGGANFHNNTGSMDPTEFFQQHGQQLLALLQQNMAKQN